MCGEAVSVVSSSRSLTPVMNEIMKMNMPMPNVTPSAATTVCFGRASRWAPGNV
jgi:hypothetical protein